MNSKPRWGGRMGSGRNFAFADGMRDTVPAALALPSHGREAQAVLLHKGSGLLVVFGAEFATKRCSKRTIGALRKPPATLPSSFLGSYSRLAGCPNATQPEPFTVSSTLLKAAGRELASRL